MTRGEMATEVAFMLNYNEGQASQDFTAKRIRQALQYAYELTVEDAKLETQKRWFKKSRSLTWPASQAQLTLPAALSQKGLIGLWDATNSSPGYQLEVSGNYTESEIFWADNDTLQWGTLGPPSTRTILVEYVADAEKIPPATANDDGVYELVPPAHHWVVVLETCVFLREMADEEVPLKWEKRLREAKFRFWKALSLGRPASDPPTISNTYQIAEGDF